MTVANILQSISLLAVAVTLAISVVQQRQLARQTAEIARQTESINKSLEKDAYEEFNSAHNLLRMSFFKDDPSTLKWYLTTRGYNANSRQKSKRTLYILMKLDIHESNFIANQEGLVTADMWTAMLNILEADLSIDDFRKTWPNAKRFYDPTFGKYVDSLMSHS